MQKRCPHCSSQIEAIEVPSGTVICPSCGLEVGSTHSVRMGEETRLAPGKSGNSEQVTVTFQRNADDEPFGVGVVPKRLGRYELLDELGAGAFGRVFRGTDSELRRTVAIKILKTERFEQSDLDSFFDEARLMASVHHPGIVAVYDVGTDQGLNYIVTQFVAAGTLHDRLGRERVSPTEAARLISQCAEAIHAAHKLQLYHRDLKPKNILLDEQGRAVVADFGLAIRRHDQNDRIGEISGSANFMSPEQVRGDVHLIDGRTDVWALGVILYLMLTDHLPFQGSVNTLVGDIQSRIPVPPRQLDESIPRELERICLKCLEKSLTERYSSAFDLAEELDGWINEDPKETIFAVSPVSAHRRSPSIARLRVWQLALGTLVMLAALGWLIRDGLTVLRVQGPSKSTMPLASKGLDPFKFDTMAVLGRPYPLLEIQPQPVIWPKAGAPTTARLFFDEPRQELLVDVPEIGLIGLGKTDTASFRLRTTINRNSLDGSAGIFWGYQVGSGNQGSESCQALVIEGYRLPRTGQLKIKLNHLMLSFSRQPGMAVPLMSGKSLYATDVTETTNSTGELILTVLRGRLNNVQWCVKEFPKVVESVASRQFANSSQGTFGVLTITSSAVFSDARITFFDKAPQ